MPYSTPHPDERSEEGSHEILQPFGLQDEPFEQKDSPRAQNKIVVLEKITYYITFNKDGWMRYISHLDLLRLFSRAARRADLKLLLTQGFNPHPVIRINKALKLGIIGNAQEAEFLLTEKIPADEFKRRMNRQLPDGITIETVKV